MGLRLGFVLFSASVDEVGQTFVWGFGAPLPFPGFGGDIALRPSWGSRRRPTQTPQPARSSRSPSLVRLPIHSPAVP